VLRPVRQIASIERTFTFDRRVRSNVKQEAVAHGHAVLCAFTFSQVVYRHCCGNVAHFVIP